MGILARLFLGDGKLSPAVRDELEAEGLVLVAEGIPGSVRYQRFKAPGRRHHGKVVPQRFGLGISEHRFVVHCRSGRTELMDSAFGKAELSALELVLESAGNLVLRVDYDALAHPGVSGELAIHLKTPEAAAITEQLNARL